jgi:hypothetical protein
MRMDDIWFSGHLSRNGITKVQIASGKRYSLPQALEPAITGDRVKLSNDLLDYFSEDWRDSEYCD